MKSDKFSKELKLHGNIRDSFIFNSKVKQYGEEYKFGLSMAAYDRYELDDVERQVEELKQHWKENRDQYEMRAEIENGYEPTVHKEDLIESTRFNFESLYTPKLSKALDEISSRDEDLIDQYVEVLASIHILKDGNVFMSANYIDTWSPEY